MHSTLFIFDKWLCIVKRDDNGIAKWCSGYLYFTYMSEHARAVGSIPAGVILFSHYPPLSYLMLVKHVTTSDPRDHSKSKPRPKSQNFSVTICPGLKTRETAKTQSFFSKKRRAGSYLCQSLHGSKTKVFFSVGCALFKYWVAYISCSVSR